MLVLCVYVCMLLCVYVCTCVSLRASVSVLIWCVCACVRARARVYISVYVCVNVSVCVCVCVCLCVCVCEVCVKHPYTSLSSDHSSLFMKNISKRKIPAQVYVSSCGKLLLLLLFNRIIQRNAEKDLSLTPPPHNHIENITSFFFSLMRFSPDVWSTAK